MADIVDVIAALEAYDDAHGNQMTLSQYVEFCRILHWFRARQPGHPLGCGDCIRYGWQRSATEERYDDAT